MHFLPEQLNNYIISHSEDEPKLLQQLTRETYQKVLQPIMLSGPYQGRVLSMISKLVRPKSVLELGTFTDYATLCLAEGLALNGKIHTIDINEELADIQRKYFDASIWVNIINDVVHYTGVGLVNMINLISPEKVIISGGISNAPDHLLLDPIKEFVYNQAYLSIVDKLTIQSSFLGDNAPIIGASMLFKH